MTRRAWAAGAVVFAAAAICAVVVIARGDDPAATSTTPPTTAQDTSVVPDGVARLADPVADPTTVPLPEPDPAVAVWFAGEGAAAGAMHDAVGEHLTSIVPTPARPCDLYNARFEGVAPPPEILAVAGTAPTSELTELVTSELHAAGRLLAACGNGDEAALDRSVAELAFQWAVLALHVDSSAGS